MKYFIEEKLKGLGNTFQFCKKLGKRVKLYTRPSNIWFLRTQLEIPQFQIPKFVTDPV